MQPSPNSVVDVYPRKAEETSGNGVADARKTSGGFSQSSPLALMNLLLAIDAPNPGF